MDDHKQVCQVNLKCSFCEKRFRREKTLRNHESDIHKKRLLCPLCNKTFQNYSNLYGHQVNIHEDVIKAKKRRFPCPKCDYKAVSKKILRKHVNITHPQHKYQCGECSFSTSINRKFQMHKINSHQLPHNSKVAVVVGF